jgi:uncharacterized repeat protein (TIGR01451 family)
MLCSAPAFAGGTAAGTDILNTVNANYQIGGVAQTTISASDTFKVDRKINFSLIEAATTGTSLVVPGQKRQVTRFQLTNTSNDSLDFALTAQNLATGTVAPHGGQDGYNVDMVWPFVDVNDNGTFEQSTDIVWYVDNLGPDQSRYIFVVGDIPTSVSNGDIGVVVLGVSAKEPSGNSSNIVNITAATESTQNGAATVETVFADQAKSGPAGNAVARDGWDAATDDYTVGAPILKIFKSSRMVSDGVSNTNFKVLPGAVIEYCVSVENASTASSALNIAVSDPLPPNITYVPMSIRINATVATPGPSQSCTGGTAASDTATDTDGGSFETSINTVTGSLANLSGGSASAVTFRATVN